MVGYSIKQMKIKPKKKKGIKNKKGIKITKVKKY
jgi:hypothetical protein